MSTNGVVVYVPGCAAVSASSANVEDADSWDPTTWDYYKKLAPSVIPGIVFGALALIGFFCLLAWIVVQLVRLRRYKKAVQAGFATQAEPLRGDDALAAGAMDYASPGDGEVKVATVPTSLTNSHRRFFRWNSTPRHAKVFLVFFFALSLATLGTCGWGLAESIKSTGSQIRTFWDIVDDVQGRIELVVGDLRNVEEAIGESAPGIQVITSLSGQTILGLSAAAGEPLSDEAVDTVQKVLSRVSTAAPRAVAQVDTVANMLQEDVLDTITDIEKDARPITMHVQHTYRYIVFAVIFGISIVAVMLLMVLLPTMRYYKTAAFVVAVSWVFAALLMFFGASLLHGTYEFSNDACLYAETYVYKRGVDGIQDANERATFRRAFWYYTGTVDYPDDTFFDNITDSTIGLQQIISTLHQEPFTSLLEILASVPTSTVATIVGSDEAAALAAVPPAVIALLGNATEALATMKSSNITPLLHEAKVLICCDVSNSVHRAWIAWTVSACLLFVVCIMGTARVISHTIVAARHIRAVLHHISSDDKNVSEGSDDADLANAHASAYGAGAAHAYGGGVYSTSFAAAGAGVVATAPPAMDGDLARPYANLPDSFGASYAYEGKPVDASFVDATPTSGASYYYYPSAPAQQAPADHRGDAAQVEFAAQTGYPTQAEYSGRKQ